MSNAAKIVLAAIGGYVLGRRKKFKLALALGMFFGAKKLKIKPQDLVSGLRKEVAELPIVSELGEQTREQLLTGARDAVNKIVAKWAENMADALTERTANLTEAATGTGGTEEPESDEAEEKPEPEGEAGEKPEPEPEAEEKPEPEDDSEEEPEPEPEPSARKRRSRAKSSETKQSSRRSSSAAKSTSSGSRSGTRKTTTRKRTSAKKQEQDDERE
ncbi:hypothetical protein [Nocardiopsis ganjiahuensis]|uniref:hypothetical protein n=1 Tax=Nocardiopsis ganjiahuensis TaxID=239984 RepID=UPI00034DDEF0|nr:hypothetical protein [Nocardiopsis ganjiahuensis]